MLPGFLVGTYRQYKHDTKTLATWLAVTAKSLGYTSEALPSEQTPIDQSKSKSKPKLKTKKQKRDAARRVPLSERKFLVNVKEFEPLAEFISENIKPSSRVPSSILAIVKRVVEARRDSNDWFKTNTLDEDEGGHEHFIGILQNVHDILEPHSLALRDTNEEDDDDTLVELENIFEGLVVEEPSEEFLNSPGLQPKTPDVGPMLYDFVDIFMEHVEGYMEESFAASALFRDVNKIYAHAKQIWYDYSHGKVDLVTASLTSNTAIDLVRRLEEDFFEEFPHFYMVEEHLLKDIKGFNSKHKDAQQLINFMFRAKCDSLGEEFGCEGLSSMFNMNLYDQARYLFFDMLSIFIMYVAMSQSMSKVVYRPTSGLGLWTPDADYDSMSNDEKYLDDQRIILELMPDLVLLSTSLSGIPSLGEDEMTKAGRGLLQKKNGKDPTFDLWMLVAGRLFCDIHHILGSNIEKPFRNVQRLGKDAKAAIAQCMSQRSRGRFQCWPEQIDNEIKKNFTARIHQSLFVDEVKAEIDHSARNVKGYKGKPDFHLHHRHPLLCGLFEFNLRAGMQEIGLIAIECTTSGPTVAHLYNALQQEGLCNTEWPDMKLFTDLQGEERIFVGSRPKNPDEYFKRLCLWRGLSPQSFAQNRRASGAVISKKKRHLTLNAEVSTVLKLRHCYNEQYPESTREAEFGALDLLEKAIDTNYTLTKDGGKLVVLPRSAAEAQDRANKNAYKHSRYSPVELLMLTQFALAREAPNCLFDYLSFHKSCWSVLQGLFDLCNPIFEKYFRPGYLGDQDSWIFGLVDYIFAFGVPITQMQQLCRKQFVFIKDLPPGFKSGFDQRAILADVGELLQNKIHNGRMRSETNVKVRKMLEARPAMAEYEAGKDERGRITFKKHKVWLHKSAACTKDQCVCGVAPIPTMRKGVRKWFTEEGGTLAHPAGRFPEKG